MERDIIKQRDQSNSGSSSILPSSTPGFHLVQQVPMKPDIGANLSIAISTHPIYLQVINYITGGYIYTQW